MNVSDEEFTEIVNQMMEYLLPKHLAKDLGVRAKDIEAWVDGKSLPAAANRQKYFLLMQRHEVWDDM